MASEDDTFAEIVEHLGDSIHVAINLRDDEYEPTYEVIGTEDMEAAIGVVAKGLFLMIYDDLFDDDPDDPEGDDLDPL